MDEIVELEIEAEMFAKILDAVSEINKEPAMVFQPNGLSIVTVDAPKQILVNLGLRKSEFYTYDVGEEKVKVTFNVSHLSDYLKGAAGSAGISITHNVSLVVPSKYGFDNFTIPLLGEVEKSMIPTRMPYDSRCKIDIRALDKVVKDAKKLDTDYLRFTVDEDENLLVSMEGERGKATSTIERGKALMSAEFQEDAGFILVADLLADGLAVGKRFTNIALMEFATQLVPIKLDYQVPFDGVLRQFIAPCTQDDKGREK